MSESLQDFIIVPREFFHLIHAPVRHVLVSSKPARGLVTMTFDGVVYDEEVSGFERDDYAYGVKLALGRIRTRIAPVIKALRFASDTLTISRKLDWLRWYMKYMKTINPITGIPTWVNPPEPAWPEEA